MAAQRWSDSVTETVLGGCHQPQVRANAGRTWEFGRLRQRKSIYE
jgi:hypothetical protein